VNVQHELRRAPAHDQMRRVPGWLFNAAAIGAIRRSAAEPSAARGEVPWSATLTVIRSVVHACIVPASRGKAASLLRALRLRRRSSVSRVCHGCVAIVQACHSRSLSGDDVSVANA
jgi:hypothetical protein